MLKHSHSKVDIKSDNISKLFLLFETLDDAGFDLLAMLLLLWCVLTAFIFAAGNLYIKFIRPKSVKSIKSSSIENDQSSSLLNQVKHEKEPDLETRPSNFTSYIEWITKVIEWINFIGQKEIAETWLLEINEKSRKLTADNRLFVEFVPVKVEQFKNVEIDNVSVDQQSDTSLIIAANLNVMEISLQIRVSSSARETANGQFELYELKMFKFTSQVKVICKPEMSQFVMRFAERPQTKVQIDSIIKSDKNYNEDTIINAILNILSTTLVDFNFHYSNKFPRFYQESGFSSKQHDKANLIENNNTIEINNNKIGLHRKLFVTVVRAENLKLDKSKEGHEVYCSVELNGQNKQTAVIRSGRDNVDNSPNWREHFLFLYPDDSELQVSLYDAFYRPITANNKDDLIGTASVSLSDLKHNPSEKLTVPLVNSKGNLSGTVNLELLLIEHGITESPADEAGLLRNFENEESIKKADSVSKKSATLTGAIMSNSSHVGDDYDSQYNHDENGVTFDQDISSTDLPPRTGSRLSSSHKSLMRTIRKRFSFNKQRSKSVERQTPLSLTKNSVNSSDFASRREPVEYDRARSVPPGSREPSIVRETIINGKKQASSIMSLTSNASFVHDASTLVVECFTNGEIKHYVIKDDKTYRKLQKNNRKLKPLKLHLFADHVFTAVHAASSHRCDVCHKTFPLRLGKQAYRCRDCAFLTHKPCHILVDRPCSANGASKLNFDFLEPLADNCLKISKENGSSVADNLSGGRCSSPLPQVRVFTPPPDDLDAMINYDEKRLV